MSPSSSVETDRKWYLDVARESPRIAQDPSEEVGSLLARLRSQFTSDLIGLADETNHHVDLRDVYPADFHGRSTKLHVPPYAFTPDDPWARFFVRALSKIDSRGAALAEIGNGTGFNGIYLLGAKDPRLVIASDIDERFVPLSRSNARQALGDERAQRFVPVTGDLFSGIPEGVELDGAFACVPQIPKPTDVQIAEGDNVAHYYCPNKYSSDLNPWGLGLNDHLLQQAKTRVRIGGSVLLNLAGRPGYPQLQRLFHQNGYDPHILHEGVIQQCPHTKLTELITLEREHGVSFEFFDTVDATGTPFHAQRAEQLRAEGVPIFHRLYAIQGYRTF